MTARVAVARPRPAWRRWTAGLLAAASACALLDPAGATGQELAIGRRVGVNKQALFVSAEYPAPFGMVVVRMVESAGQLSMLHFISQQGVVVVPPHLLEGMAPSTQAELRWYLDVDGKTHASVLLPCKGAADLPPSELACKRAYIFFDGALRRVVAYTPRDGGSAVSYIDVPN